MIQMEQFGPFDLLHRLGAGGMAETFLTRVRGAEKGQEFVLKRILPEISGDPESERALIEEAKLAASLHHPNIVSSLPAGNVEGRTYIPMEFIFGDDLRNVVQKAMVKRKIPSDRFFLAVIAQAARGLGHAHAATDDTGASLELVHRDVSPPNIMLGFDGIVRVVDFGIARLRPGASTVRTGQLKGKFAYMSPEQALGIGVDKRSDIFCLGIVLYELLTRKRLFRDDTPLKTVRNVSKAQITPPTQVRPTLDQAIEPIVMKALARATDDRYASAEEFADAIDEYLANHGGPVETTEIAAVMRNTCGDSFDTMRQLIGEDYEGPLPVEDLKIPETGVLAENVKQPASSSVVKPRSRIARPSKLTMALFIGAAAVVAISVALLFR